MRSHFRAVLVLFALAFYPAYSQYTELINTNRPGFSEGAFSVGRNVLQLETGLLFGQENHRLLNTELTGYGIDYTLRYGFVKEQLEIRWTGEFQASNVKYTAINPPKEESVSNFKSNVIGLKYLVYDPYVKKDLKGPNLYSWRANNKFQWSDLVPAISIFAGINFDLDDQNYYLPKDNVSISPKLVIATQNNFKNGLVLVTNLIGDRLIAEYPTYSYIVTLTHHPFQYFSFFVENQGIISDFYADQLIRAGGAYLLNKDLQLDASATYGLKDTPTVFYARLGVAYRFDRHKKDDYLEEMDPKNTDQKEGGKKEKKKKRKKGSEMDDIEDFDSGNDTN